MFLHNINLKQNLMSQTYDLKIVRIVNVTFDKKEEFCRTQDPVLNFSHISHYLARLIHVKGSTTVKKSKNWIMENYSLSSGHFKLWLTKFHNTKHCKPYWLEKTLQLLCMYIHIKSSDGFSILYTRSEKKTFQFVTCSDRMRAKRPLTAF